MINITDEMIENHVQKIIRMVRSIELNKVSLLVGDNGSGKSMVRKQLTFGVSKKIDTDDKIPVKSVSMQKRTESNPMFGALSSAMHDSSWNPTSLSTYHSIDSLINCISNESYKKSYFVIDEPEIGMSEESQIGVAALLKSCMPFILENSYGVLIITHSRSFVREFKDIADFYSLGIFEDYDSADLWLEREIKPMDFAFLEEWSNKLYNCIEDHLSS